MLEDLVSGSGSAKGWHQSWPGDIRKTEGSGLGEGEAASTSHSVSMQTFLRPSLVKLHGRDQSRIES